jgi:hypothetical protein
MSSDGGLLDELGALIKDIKDDWYEASCDLMNDRMEKLEEHFWDIFIK